MSERLLAKVISQVLGISKIPCLQDASARTHIECLLLARCAIFQEAPP